MKKIITAVGLFVLILLFVIVQFNCMQPTEKKQMTKAEQIEKGKELVNIGGCNDCHSPKVMTQMGPVPDTTLLLSGYQSSKTLPAANPDLVKPGQWILADQNFTAYVGPWGISYAANITPDTMTGIGSWNAETFIKAMREGKYMGSGRSLLPPMPWEAIGKLKDSDLKAIFAYLHSLKPVHNQVPNPVPPDKIAEVLMPKK